MNSYKKSGVDIETGNNFIKSIKGNVETTFSNRPGVISTIGGFGSMFDLSKERGLNGPVLVASTDGVGSKIKFAQKYGYNSKIGIDLVAMSVNDVICQGARPLFFLDYYATGKIDIHRGNEIISGIVEGCNQAECALVGGETAEMPRIYSGDDYDLAGFCVGAVQKTFIRPFKIDDGDILLGLPSSGIHSNGFSMINLDLNEKYIDDVMKPTRIYVNAFNGFVEYAKAIAHITGGGITENLVRIIPDEFTAEVNLNSWAYPRVFDYIKNGDITFDGASVSEDEMLRVFNCGIGMILILNPCYVDTVRDILEERGEKSFQIGQVKKTNSSNKIVYIGKLFNE